MGNYREGSFTATFRNDTPIEILKAFQAFALLKELPYISDTSDYRDDLKRYMKTLFPEPNEKIEALLNTQYLDYLGFEPNYMVDICVDGKTETIDMGEFGYFRYCQYMSSHHEFNFDEFNDFFSGIEPDEFFKSIGTSFESVCKFVDEKRFSKFSFTCKFFGKRYDNELDKAFDAFKDYIVYTTEMLGKIRDEDGTLHKNYFCVDPDDIYYINRLTEIMCNGCDSRENGEFCPQMSFCSRVFRRGINVGYSDKKELDDITPEVWEILNKRKHFSN